MSGWNDRPTSMWRRQLNRRRWLFCGLVVLIIFLTAHPTGVYMPDNCPTITAGPRMQWDVPPTWQKLRQLERNLPQHNLDLPFPEGKDGRYVKFSNQVKRLGWNNAFNEILMNTHLAYESKRAYVFQPFVWKEEHYPWPQQVYRENESLPHTPLSAIISGPSAGGSWDVGDGAPRSISEEWFDVVCPREERRIINTGEVKPTIGWADGIDIFNYWKKILLDAPERCIEIEPENSEKDYHPQTFDLWLWGNTRILSLWPMFSQSPTSRLLEPSSIVLSAVEKNTYLFDPCSPRSWVPVSRSPYDHMLAIHVRRGDFKEACSELARWNSTFYSWNLLEQLPDAFTPPPGGKQGDNTPENVEKYLEHCLPQFDDIVAKVRDSRYDYLQQSKTGRKKLDKIFLLTNAKGEWLDQLKATLREDGWRTIVTSEDLELDQEQTEVSMSVDMEIARRAAVFVGNGMIATGKLSPENKSHVDLPPYSFSSCSLTAAMDYDRKSNVSSFYGGRKGSLDALNADFPVTTAGRSRDDASSFYNPEQVPRNSLDPVNGPRTSTAGYNRGSFFHAGREEPLKGGSDEEEEAGHRVGEAIWDVYADFNNTGPRYSSAFGQTEKGCEAWPAGE
ncbi:hypothetical protein C0992_008035 [Termitomyces sp. T32_za158]|nr:hypothetical protein C0992_008035 [Termitomyces sp. T32_za158]